MSLHTDLIDIKPIKHRKNYNLIVERILELIKKNDLKLGDMLPTQKDFARLLNVSLQSVREAYSTLEICGIIKTVGGKGTIVNIDNVNFFLKPSELNTLILKEDFINCFELSKTLEKESYLVCAAKSSDEDLEQIEKALNNLVDEYKRTGTYSLRSDEKFHLEVARSTRNRLLKDLMEYLWMVQKNNRKLWQDLINRKYKEFHDFPDKDIEFNINIFNLIKERDIKKINLAVEKYFSHLEKLFLKYI
jgi:GntR family transcriptional repressor for pyruvate dehydrogenase complex